jgi:hypothetical protein
MTGHPVRIPLRPPPALDADTAVSADELVELRAGSPARTALLLRQVTGIADAFNRRDFDAYLSFYDPDVELVIARLEAGGLWGGDFDELYRGHEGLLEATRQWLDVWEDLRIEPDELIDEGGPSYAMLATWTGRGGGSGVEVTTSYQARHTLARGRVGRVAFWPDREAVMSDLGLTP